MMSEVPPEVKRYLELTHYNAWANRRAAALLGTLSEAQLPRPLLLLSHLLRAERVWLGRLQGTADATTLPLWETDSLSVCRAQVESNTAALEALVSGLTPTDLAKVVFYTSSQGTAYRTAVQDILSHVFNHASHHRGQIALLVREAGQTPLPLDYIVYLRLKG